MDDFLPDSPIDKSKNTDDYSYLGSDVASSFSGRVKELDKQRVEQLARPNCLSVPHTLNKFIKFDWEGSLNKLMKLSWEGRPNELVSKNRLY